MTIEGTAFGNCEICRRCGAIGDQVWIDRVLYWCTACRVGKAETHKDLLDALAPVDPTAPRLPRRKLIYRTP